MARVPRTFSSTWLGDKPLEEDEAVPELHRMSEAELDRFIRRCASALRSHARDFQVEHDKESALAAFESVMALLLEAREAYPDKRADFDAVLSRAGYPVPEN